LSRFPSADSLTAMVNNVTTSMMNVKFVLAPASQMVSAFRRAVLPISSAMPVVVVVTGDEASCQHLGSRLFSVEAKDVDVGMMEDTLRELANITAGQVKRAMALDAALGLPRIIHGAGAWDSGESGKQLIVLRADCDDIHLEVQVAARAA
jgi:CheY-specific phosphatase CheX